MQQNFIETDTTEASDIDPTFFSFDDGVVKDSESGDDNETLEETETDENGYYLDGEEDIEGMEEVESVKMDMGKSYEIETEQSEVEHSNADEDVINTRDIASNNEAEQSDDLSKACDIASTHEVEQNEDIINTRDIASTHKVEQNEDIINTRDIASTNEVEENEDIINTRDIASNNKVEQNEDEDTSKDNNDNDVEEIENAAPPNPTPPITGGAKPKATWKPEPEDKKNARKAWCQWGHIVYPHDWNIPSKSSIEGLVKAVDKLTDDLYCKTQKATFECLSSSTFSLDKVKELPILKFLKSADNNVGKEIEWHLKVVYDSAVVMVNVVYLKLFLL